MSSDRVSGRSVRRGLLAAAGVVAIGAAAVGVTAAIGSGEPTDATGWETVHPGIDLVSIKNVGTRHRSGDAVVFTEGEQLITLNVSTGAVSTTELAGLLGVSDDWSLFPELSLENSVWILVLYGFITDGEPGFDDRHIRATSSTGYDWQVHESSGRLVAADNGFATVSNDLVTMPDGESVRTPWGDDFQRSGQVGAGDRIDVLGDRTAPNVPPRIWSLANGDWTPGPELGDAVTTTDFFSSGERTWLLGSGLGDPLYVAWSSDDGVNWTRHGIEGIAAGNGGLLGLRYSDEDSFLAVLDRCLSTSPCEAGLGERLVIRGDSTGISVLSPIGDDSEPVGRRFFIGDAGQSIMALHQTGRLADVDIRTHAFPDTSVYTSVSSPTAD